MNLGWRWTAAQTGLTCCGASLQERDAGSRLVDGCWWRPVAARRPRALRLSSATDWRPGSSLQMSWMPLSVIGWPAKPGSRDNQSGAGH